MLSIQGKGHLMKSTPTTSSRRNLLQWAVGIAAGGAAATTLAAIPAASMPDPVFGLISAYHKACQSRANIENALVAAERELEEAGDLHPRVISVGNPWSGLPPPASTTHRDIDLYTPADMYPVRNRDEHAMLSAAIARRDARITPLLAALNDAEDAESAALDKIHKVPPTTREGALAVIELHREWIRV
jgi:hypothetical protein